MKPPENFVEKEGTLGRENTAEQRSKRLKRIGFGTIQSNFSRILQ